MEITLFPSGIESKCPEFVLSSCYNLLPSTLSYFKLNSCCYSCRCFGSIQCKGHGKKGISVWMRIKYALRTLCSFNKMSYFWNSISRRFIRISILAGIQKPRWWHYTHITHKTHLTDIGTVLKYNNIATLREFSLSLCQLICCCCWCPFGRCSLCWFPLLRFGVGFFASIVFATML